MKEKEQKFISKNYKYLLIGFIPAEKETISDPLLGETTIYYRLCGMTLLKKFPIKQNIVSSNNYSTGSFGSGFNPSTTDLENS